MQKPSHLLEDKNFRLYAPHMASVDLQAALFHALLETHDQLAQHFVWAARQKPTPQNTMDYLEHITATWRKDSVETGDRFVWFMMTRRNSIVGVISLSVVDADIPFLEFGYWCRTSEQRCGRTRRAAAMLKNHAIDDLGARRLQIRCEETNTGSSKLAESLGFTLEGIARNSLLWPNGSVRNMRIYSLCSS